MNSVVNLSWEQAQKLGSNTLRSYGVRQETADCVAEALVLADSDGQPSHGIARLPSYIEQLLSCKVDGITKPTIKALKPACIEVNANGGFAYPAIHCAVEALSEACTKQGISMAAVIGSHHCGVAGHPVEKLANRGFIGMIFANTPKAIPMAGGTRAIFGTNPIAFAAPRLARDPIVIDLSLSVVARGKIVLAAKNNQSIPIDWGFDQDGNPSTNPEAVLAGSLNSIGGAKGAALAFMVEILAGAFVKSQFGFEASSFLDGKGSPPKTGQFLICMNAEEFNSDFLLNIERLVQEVKIEQGARLPGERRFLLRREAIKSGIKYPQNLIDSLRDLQLKGSGS